MLTDADFDSDVLSSVAAFVRVDAPEPYKQFTCLCYTAASATTTITTKIDNNNTKNTFSMKYLLYCLLPFLIVRLSYRRRLSCLKFKVAFLIFVT